MLKLYSYFRSSASYRVRIALHWKELKFEYLPIHLLKDGGQQKLESFRRINPMAHVPALEHDGFLIAESVAIVDYLDRVFEKRPVFPSAAKDRARTMQICEIINSGIQPLQNLKVMSYIENELGLGKPASLSWMQHWIAQGLKSLELALKESAGTFAVGDEVTAADMFLVPQCFASRRFGIRIEDYPHIARTEVNCLQLAPFQAAHPERQPDYSA